jgi:hypothetical protein
MPQLRVVFKLFHFAKGNGRGPPSRRSKVAATHRSSARRISASSVIERNLIHHEHITNGFPYRPGAALSKNDRATQSDSNQQRADRHWNCEKRQGEKRSEKIDSAPDHQSPRNLGGGLKHKHWPTAKASRSGFAIEVWMKSATSHAGTPSTSHALIACSTQFNRL